MDIYWCRKCNFIGEPRKELSSCNLTMRFCRECDASHVYQVLVKSFSEWSRLGLRIKKGSKAVTFNDRDLALFADYQTYDPSPYHELFYGDYEDYDCHPCYEDIF